MNDFPQMSSSKYESCNYLTTYDGITEPGFGYQLQRRITTTSDDPADQVRKFLKLQNMEQKQKGHLMTQTKRRIVQVFIVDNDDYVPLEKAVLYSGSQKLTDATDQELFFEIDVKALLEKHNQERVKMLNKKRSDSAGKDVFLEEIKIRDLIMNIVTIATF